MVGPGHPFLDLHGDEGKGPPVSTPELLHDTTTTTEADVRPATPTAAEVSRRMFLRVGATGAATVGLYAAGSSLLPGLGNRGLLSADGVFGAASIAIADSVYTEVFPTSPLIMKPFTDPLTVPKAARPATDYKTWASVPGPQQGGQSSQGKETHQKWCSDLPAEYDKDPLIYKFDVKVAGHSFTSSSVLPLT